MNSKKARPKGFGRAFVLPMPELPEVEMARRRLVQWMRGRRVVKTDAEAGGRTLSKEDRAAFAAMAGPLNETRRKGKFLLLVFQKTQGLLVHLGMTGKFLKRNAKATTLPEKWVRASLLLDNGTIIHFQDPRKFGRLETIAPADWEQHPSVAKLGFDALEGQLTVEALQAVLLKSKQPLKVALMDQSKIAGFGNIHAAEALFRARLHPMRLAGSLTTAEWKQLQRGLTAALQFGLEEQGRSDEAQYVEERKAPNPFLVYGRKGQPCLSCKSPIAQQTQAGRSTFYCPTCQRPLKKNATKRAS